MNTEWTQIGNVLEKGVLDESSVSPAMVQGRGISGRCVYLPGSLASFLHPTLKPHSCHVRSDGGWAGMLPPIVLLCESVSSISLYTESVSVEGQWIFLGTQLTQLSQRHPRTDRRSASCSNKRPCFSILGTFQCTSWAPLLSFGWWVSPALF